MSEDEKPRPTAESARIIVMGAALELGISIPQANILFRRALQSNGAYNEMASRMYDLLHPDQDED